MTSTLKQEAVLNYSPTKLKACRSSIKKNNAGLLIHQKMISHYLRKSFHSTPRSVWHLKKKLLQFTNILLVVNKTANSSFCFKILCICHKIHKTVILKKKKKHSVNNLLYQWNKSPFSWLQNEDEFLRCIVCTCIMNSPGLYI